MLALRDRADLPLVAAGPERIYRVVD